MGREIMKGVDNYKYGLSFENGKKDTQNYSINLKRSRNTGPMQ
jgi:hypothetical protein